MGYTTCQTDLLLGLGASSISDAKYGYMQNQKKVEAYKETVLGGELAIFKGHLLNPTDLLLKEAILALACNGELTLDESLTHTLPQNAFSELNEMQQEGLLYLSDGVLTVTELGKAFVRNICMVFDLKLKQSEPGQQQVFSKAI